MLALTISEHGGLDRLELRDDLPVPAIVAPDQVRVRVRAAAVNHLDLFVLGGMPGVRLRPPWIMGADCAGIIDEIGAGVTGLAPGDPVIVNPGISDGTCEYCRAGEQPLCVHYGILGEHFPGTLAQYVVVPASNVRVIPESIAPETAAAFTLATLTAWRMVVTRARVQPGEDVLIWGIGGGVALAALQICKQRGARVWAVSGSPEKLARARELGADELLDRTSMDVGRVVRERTNKRGVQVVIDNVGEATWSQSLVALGRAGRLVTCGGTSGPMLETDVRRLFWNQWSVLGSTMGNDAEFSAIADELRAGRLLPPIDSVFPLARASEAFARLQSGQQFGKIAVSIP
jgi:NADPH:quinone reductase-like Zn-dependent oxidoreductase